MHRYAIVPRNAPPAYWENWWAPTGAEQGAYVLLQSLRTGTDADTDAVVLQGRLFSGLHACALFSDLDSALAHLAVRS